MPVSHEIKSQLAKLLATEDLVVEHKKVSTACFNVHTRVLTLPLWEKASNLVYDLLVGHEVGHALFTPDEDWLETVKVPQQFVNVVEDARIEKLMKRKYMGLAKTFFNGYKELNEEDFFQLADENISKFNLADRANLYFKVGNFVTLDFNPEEKEIIDLIAATETFADVLVAAEELYKYCKKEKEQQQKVFDFDSHQQQGDSNSSANEMSEEQPNDEQEDQSDSSQPEQSDETGSSSGDQTQDNSQVPDKDPEIRTAESLQDKIRDLVGMNDQENVYVEIPQVNLDTVIASNSEVHEEIDNSFKMQQKNNNEIATERNISSCNLFAKPDSEYRKFKVAAQKEVNYLVKEFECRKAADAYSRASTARTGVLDTARLHSYKYNEDLFKKVTVIPDGKNHGLVFILDWSGSMQNVLLDTCKQLFNLIWFCKKVAIPFEVYAFTNEWSRCRYDYDEQRYVPADFDCHYQKKEGLLCVEDQFSLMNLFTSKVSGRELEHQMMNIWRLAMCFINTYTCEYTYPSRLCLSGTPLNEALICLHQILPKFQRENKLQKVQCIVLTDGEASYIPYHQEVKRAWEKESHLGTRHVNPNSAFLRDRKLGTTYKFGYGYHEFTDILLRNLKDKFPTTNFIGIRVLSGRDVNRFIGLYHSLSDKDYKQYIKIQEDWKKLKSFTITKSGYHAYFGLSSSALSQDADFEVAECATKAQIKSAFVKSLKVKKFNKKVLGEFISLVA